MLSSLERIYYTYIYIYLTFQSLDCGNNVNNFKKENKRLVKKIGKFFAL